MLDKKLMHFSWIRNYRKKKKRWKECETLKPSLKEIISMYKFFYLAGGQTLNLRYIYDKSDHSGILRIETALRNAIRNFLRICLLHSGLKIYWKWKNIITLLYLYCHLILTVEENGFMIVVLGGKQWIFFLALPLIICTYLSS